MKKNFFIILMLLTVVAAGPAASAVSFNGQVSAWFAWADEGQAGLRYIPDAGMNLRLGRERELEADLAVNSFLHTPARRNEAMTNFAGLSLYRAWARYRSSRFETRFGLQKINFGPVRILRTLMWFDSTDPRDPLKLTDGVYGVLARYYFRNNANVWAWALYGNDVLKGLDVLKADPKRPEYGGRFEFPLLTGDAALSFHRRYADQDNWKALTASPLPDGAENRFAADGTWDIGIGVWFEAAVEEMAVNSTSRVQRDFLTLGADYTFLPGLHVLAEHMLVRAGIPLSGSDRLRHMTALESDYPLTILDSINMIDYYDWETRKFYFFLGWQRTYDNWKINLMGFSAPKTGDNVFSGSGVQLLVTFNH